MLAKCPNCGSERFKYELRSAGTQSKSNYYRTGVKNSYLFASGKKSYHSERKQKTVGFCPDCGYIEDKQEKGCLYYLLCLMFWPISLSVWFYRTNLIRLQKKWKALIIVAFWLVLMLIAALMSAQETETSGDSIWSAEYTDLSCFDYYIDGDSLTLKKYHGTSHKVNIAEEYIVDGECFTVVALDGTFALKSVDSVIVPDTVISIASNTFNSCGIDYLYLPASLIDFAGWSYFHDVEAIYYGGTEEDWALLYTKKRSNLDVVKISYNTKIADLITE